MSDALRFIRARIAEDDAEARRWIAQREPWRGESFAVFLAGTEERVLAECEAKRRVLALHDFDFDAPAGAESSWDEFTTCRTCRGDVGDYPCHTLRALVSVYADHPDYDPEWSLD